MSETEKTNNSLELSYSQAMAFQPTEVQSLQAEQEEISGYAKREASFGQISVDENGITPGMKLHVLTPAREMLGRWENAYSAFDVQIDPYKHDIDAAESAESEIVELKAKAAQQIEQISRRADADLDYKNAKEAQDETQDRFRDLRMKAGGREANLSAYAFYYWPAMMLIGVTEWLINYDTLVSFLGIPAVAAGATIILGVLLAFAAHAHGTILRQWSNRFAPERSGSERRGEWRYFALATFSLLLVLLAAGGARYEAVVRVVVHLEQSTAGVNVLGSEATLEQNPVRDVMLSMLANIAAWAVGVFLAYLTHDPDPEYMRSAKNARDAKKRFRKLHRKVEDEIKTEEAKVQKGMSQLATVVEQRRAKVKKPFEMWESLKRRNLLIQESVEAITQGNLSMYRSELMKQDGLQLIKNGEALNPYSYNQMDFGSAKEILNSKAV